MFTATKGAPQLPNPFDLAGMIPGGIAPHMPGLEELGRTVNQFGQEEILGMVEELFPGLRSAFGQAGQNVASMLRGEVPQDVADMLQDNVAAQSLSQGTAGSQLAGKGFARSLGLTSLDLQNQGLGQMMGMTGHIRQNLMPEPYDIGQNIPNITDLYNAGAGQAMANYNHWLTLENLKLAKRGMAAGGGGGGGMSINPGMPGLATRAAATPGAPFQTGGSHAVGPGGPSSAGAMTAAPWMTPPGAIGTPGAEPFGHGVNPSYNPFAGAFDYSPTTGYGGGFANPYGPQAPTNVMDFMTNPLTVGFNYSLPGAQNW